MMTGGSHFGWNEHKCGLFLRDMHKGYPDGDPESEAMLAPHFNREHDIAKQPVSSLHGERPDNGDMPINSKTRRAYPVEQLAAQKLSLKKREVPVGSSQQKTRKCMLGGNHSKMGVNIGSMVEGDALAVCWLLADVEHTAILCLEEFCCCFQFEYPV
jgi:hypothetical protein